MLQTPLPSLPMQTSQESVYTSIFPMPWGASLVFKHDGQKLLQIRFAESTPLTEMQAFEDNAFGKQLHAALLAYKQGDETLLKALPYFLPKNSTVFQRKVWQALSDLDWGQTCSYGQLAEQVGSAGAARAVGSALAKNPFPVLLPCHRVLGSQGQLTGFMGSKEGTRDTALKQAMLAFEQNASIKI